MPRSAATAFAAGVSSGASSWSTDDDAGGQPAPPLDGHRRPARGGQRATASTRRQPVHARQPAHAQQQPGGGGPPSGALRAPSQPRLARGLIKAKKVDAEGVTLELVVLPAVHASGKLSLRYWYDGACPSEVTERRLNLGQVVEWNRIAALETDAGIEGVITDRTTLLVLKRRESEAFVLSLVGG